MRNQTEGGPFLNGRETLKVQFDEKIWKVLRKESLAMVLKDGPGRYVGLISRCSSSQR
jgi:hypothetical protein